MGKGRKRIEHNTSRTAQYTCMSRAASYLDKRPEYRCDDHIAVKLVPGYLIPFMKIGMVRRFSPKGIYEYVIARTRYIDSVFKDAVEKDFPQILVFGAGFDSRGIRFLGTDSKTKVFELDVPITQNRKIEHLRELGIEIHPNITFIPIDFNKESPGRKLIEYGFRKNKRSLFILEGLTMYLDPGSVDLTFRMISEFAGSGSEVVFDYIYSSVLREENLYYGEKAIRNKVRKADEGWVFGLEKGEIKKFLEKYDLDLVEDLDSKGLENRYFRDGNGNIIARINGTHCITHAKRT
jgi:methyltransferase (TIGR00027 family)